MWLAAVGLLCILAAAPVGAQAAPSCAGRSDLVGPCFRIRGRIFVANGNPPFRIWRVGTKRLLGVSTRVCHEDDCSTMPAALRALVDWEHSVFADLVVCPLTRSRPGWMQMVCIESATNLRRGDY